MKNIVFLILTIFLSTNSFAAAPTRAYTYVSNTTIDPAQNNANENALYSYLQTGVDTYAASSITGAAISPSASIPYISLSLSNSIVNADISTTAAIVGSKLNLTEPGIIGSVTPSTGKFTDLEATTTFKLGTTHQGDILYDNGTSLVRLTPGTAGTVLQTQGASANPQWAFPSGQLGTWDDSSYSADTSYLAATDGFVMAAVTIQGNAVKSASILTDSANPPTIARAVGSSTSSTTAFTTTLTCPVKKGNYWKVSNVAGSSVGQIYWIPLGS